MEPSQPLHHHLLPIIAPSTATRRLNGSLLYTADQCSVRAVQVQQMGEGCDGGLEVCDVVGGAGEAVDEEGGLDVRIDGLLLSCHALHLRCE